VPFRQSQAGQIERFRTAWSDAGQPREPRVSLSRSLFATSTTTIAPTSVVAVPESDPVGVIDNADVLESILTHVAPALGWR